MKFKYFILSILILGSVTDASCMETEDSVLVVRRKKMQAIKSNWKKVKPQDDSLFAVSNSDQGYLVNYYHEESFPVGSSEDFLKSKKGQVLGPYESGNLISLYKVMAKEENSDSAMVAHILFGYSGGYRPVPASPRTREDAKKSADSLCELIRSGKVVFEDVVESVTDDPGSLNGNKGNYGWFTRDSPFVQPYEDAGFDNEVGATVVVESVFGFHIIQVKAKSQPRDFWKVLVITKSIDTCIDYNGNPIIIHDAEFPGGVEVLDAYLSSESEKSSVLNKGELNDKWIPFSFDVDEQGLVQNVQVLDVDFMSTEIEAEVLRIVQNMPRWIPAATCRGRIRISTYGAMRL